MEQASEPLMYIIWEEFFSWSTANQTRLPQPSDSPNLIRKLLYPQKREQRTKSIHEIKRA